MTDSKTLQYNIQYASLALIYYDYALTFGDEVQYIWGQRFKTSTVLYYFCRYSLIANALYLLSTAEKGSLKVCDVGYKVCSALSLLCRLAVIAVWTARTYAIFSGSRRVLIFFGGLGLACLVVNIIHATSASCQGSAQLAAVILSILVCMFEVSSALCTIVRAVQTRFVYDPHLTPKGGMMQLLIDQGVLYFGIVSFFCVGALILNFRAPGGFLQRLLNALTLPISGIMTARFLLHLRRWEHRHTVGTEDDETTLQTIQFTQNARRSGSFMDDFGEDPVRLAERDRDERYARNKTQSIISEGEDFSDRGEGPSSMV